MATNKQQLGTFGEVTVAKHVDCPQCKRKGTLKSLIQNFKCADIICDFCGYLAQVKTSLSSDTSLACPNKILGAAWGPLRDRMESGKYFSLFIVIVEPDWLNKKLPNFAIYFLPAELQIPEMFVPRKPLSATAKRSGWQGVIYNLKLVRERIIKIK